MQCTFSSVFIYPYDTTVFGIQGYIKIPFSMLFLKSKNFLIVLELTKTIYYLRDFYKMQLS